MHSSAWKGVSQCCWYYSLYTSYHTIPATSIGSGVVVSYSMLRPSWYLCMASALCILFVTSNWRLSASPLPSFCILFNSIGSLLCENYCSKNERILGIPLYFIVRTFSSSSMGNIHCHPSGILVLGDFQSGSTGRSVMQVKQTSNLLDFSRIV